MTGDANEESPQLHISAGLTGSTFQHHVARVHGGAVYVQEVQYCPSGKSDTTCSVPVTILGDVLFQANMAIGDPYFGTGKKVKNLKEEYQVGKGGAIAVSNNIELLVGADPNKAQVGDGGTIEFKELDSGSSVVFSNNVAVGGVSHSIYAVPPTNGKTPLTSVQFSSCPRGSFAWPGDKSGLTSFSKEALGINFVGCPNACPKGDTTTGTLYTDYKTNFQFKEPASVCTNPCPLGHFCSGDFSSGIPLALCPPTTYGAAVSLFSPTCSGSCPEPSDCPAPGGATNPEGPATCGEAGQSLVVITVPRCRMSQTFTVFNEEEKSFSGRSEDGQPTMRTVFGPVAGTINRHFKVDPGGILHVSYLQLEEGFVVDAGTGPDSDGSILFNLGRTVFLNVTIHKPAIDIDQPASERPKKAHKGGCLFSGSGSTLMVVNSMFKHCYASISGGAIHFEGHTFNVTNSQFHHNTVDQNDPSSNDGGGAIYLADGNEGLSYVTFFNNSQDAGMNEFKNNKKLACTENSTPSCSFSPNTIAWKRKSGSRIDFLFCPANTYALSGLSTNETGGDNNVHCYEKHTPHEGIHSVLVTQLCHPKADILPAGPTKTDANAAREYGIIRRDFYGCPSTCNDGESTVPLNTIGKRQEQPGQPQAFCQPCPHDFYCANGRVDKCPLGMNFEPVLFCD